MRSRHSPQALFPLGVLLLLAALSFWLEYAVQPQAARSGGKNRHDPDFIVENFTLKRFDAKGKLQHTLQATKMTHFPDDDSTIVADPRLTMTGGEVPQRIRAKTALVSADGVEVVLVNNVFASRDPSRDQPASTLTTRVLTVFPDDEISRTNEPVILTQGDSVVYGSGLEANNITSVYKLSGPVTGTIQPKKK